jgi:hypothetical protein
MGFSTQGVRPGLQSHFEATCTAMLESHSSSTSSPNPPPSHPRPMKQSPYFSLLRHSKPPCILAVTSPMSLLLQMGTYRAQDCLIILIPIGSQPPSALICNCFFHVRFIESNSPLVNSIKYISSLISTGTSHRLCAPSSMYSYSHIKSIRLSSIIRTLHVSAPLTIIRCTSCRGNCYNLHSNCVKYLRNTRSRDSSVGIATGYGLEDGGVGVRDPVGQAFSLLHVVQTGSGVHPTSYPMCTEGSFPGSKTAGV